MVLRVQCDAKEPTCAISAPYDVCEAREVQSSLPRPSPGPCLDIATARLRSRVRTPYADFNDSHVPTYVFSSPYDACGALELRLGLIDLLASSLAISH